jgi:hypothetical protein
MHFVSQLSSCSLKSEKAHESGEKAPCPTNASIFSKLYLTKILDISKYGCHDSISRGPSACIFYYPY